MRTAEVSADSMNPRPRALTLKAEAACEAETCIIAAQFAVRNKVHWSSVCRPDCVCACGKG